MDQERRDAAAWAKEWQIRRRNRRLLYMVAAAALIVVIIYGIHFTIVHVERSTFASEDEMRQAMQGRYAREHDYTDYVIEGDDITETYLAYSHYNRDYAERYGYNYDEKDSVYEDRIVEWDHRNGVFRTEWMGDFIVDKDGNIRRDSSSTDYVFYKTGEPRPEPIDPATLKHPEGTENIELSPEEEEAAEEREEDLQETEEALEEAASEGEPAGESASEESAPEDSTEEEDSPEA